VMAAFTTLEKDVYPSQRNWRTMGAMRRTISDRKTTVANVSRAIAAWIFLRRRFVAWGSERRIRYNAIFTVR